MSHLKIYIDLVHLNHDKSMHQSVKESRFKFGVKQLFVSVLCLVVQMVTLNTHNVMGMC